MKKGLIIVSLLGLVLTGCKKEPYVVKSSLDVSQSFEVKNDNKKMVRLNPGAYPTDLNINSSRAKATVKTADKKNVTFRLLLPKNIKFPTNGTLELSPAQSGQPFHTSVHVQTEVQDGQPQRDREDCTFTERDYECFVTGNPPTPVCREVVRTRWGKRTVDFFVRSYNRQIEVLLTPSQASDPAASLQGSRVDSERIYTGEGMCR